MSAYLHNYPHQRLRIIILQIWFRTQISLASLPLLDLTYGGFQNPFRGHLTIGGIARNYRILNDNVTVATQRDSSPVLQL